MDDKQYKIKELAKYYVERYSLPTNFQSDSYDGANDGLGTYITALTRIMQKVSIGNTNLWEISKPKNQARQITISYFEQYCFQQWEEYIKKHCESYDSKTLSADKKRVDEQYTCINEQSEDWYKHMDALKDIDPMIPVFPKEQYYFIKNTIMLTAIFELFFTPIDDKILEDDLYQYMYLRQGASPEKRDIDIMNKLEHPEGNYYHRKKDPD